jgi:hypothetical protein
MSDEDHYEFDRQECPAPAEARSLLEAPPSVAVFANKAEGWINVLTCKVGANVEATSVTITTYSDEKLQAWLDAADKGGPIYVFTTDRLR